MEIHEKIRSLIEDYDTNQTKLAKQIGVDRKQIQRWAKGETEMGITKLQALCNYFKVSADYILNLPITHDRTKEEILERTKQMKNKISKEDVEDIIRWAEYQGHIRGDIEILIDNIYDHEDENK